MPHRSSTKRPRDFNQRAYQIVRESTGEAARSVPPRKNPAAVALGRLGGMKGGAARAATLSADRRSEIARKAAGTRWAKRTGEREK